MSSGAWLISRSSLTDGPNLDEFPQLSRSRPCRSSPAQSRCPPIKPTRPPWAGRLSALAAALVSSLCELLPRHSSDGQGLYSVSSVRSRSATSSGWSSSESNSIALSPDIALRSALFGYTLALAQLAPLGGGQRSRSALSFLYRCPLLCSISSYRCRCSGFAPHFLLLLVTA